MPRYDDQFDSDVDVFRAEDVNDGGNDNDNDNSNNNNYARVLAAEKEISKLVEFFLAHQSEDDGETNREKLRRLGKIERFDLMLMVQDFRYQTNTEYRLFYSADDAAASQSEPLPEELIKEIQKQAGMNIIRKHPLRTFGASVLLGLAAFALPLIGMMIFEAATGGVAMSAILPLLPFLAAFGPLGAAVAFAGLISAAALVIYGISIGVTAAATNKNIDVVDAEDAFDPSQYNEQMKGLGADEGAFANHGMRLDLPAETQPFSLTSNTVARTGHQQQQQFSMNAENNFDL